ncbi:MAG: DUF2974 domain-containing protein [Clostridiales Family XIII bacterium]|jgi:SepF-like predicted cell division protein (DUF552 family)|nr:DUF2974 domain-containing protein [Clostridiales Family XIII bacterium]
MTSENNAARSEYLDDNARLALLASLVYLDRLLYEDGLPDSDAGEIKEVAVEDGPIVAERAKEALVELKKKELFDGYGKDDFPGKMTEEEWRATLRSAAADPCLQRVRVAGYYDKFGGKEGRGVMFRDEGTGDVAIVFMGTGKFEWKVDAKGLTGRGLSASQKDAVQFFENMRATFGLGGNGGRVFVSGHSAGGNKAEVVTVLFPDIVTKCLSYDGQGHSKWFMETYRETIDRIREEDRKIKEEDRKSKEEKIVRVAEIGDFVHALGIPLKSATYYARQDTHGGTAYGDPPQLSHCPNAILREDGTFTEELNTGEPALARLVNKLTLAIMEREDAEELATGVMGFLEGERNWGELWKTLELFGALLEETERPSDGKLEDCKSENGEPGTDSTFREDFLEALGDRETRRAVVALLSEMIYGHGDDGYKGERRLEPALDAALDDPELLMALTEYLIALRPLFDDAANGRGREALMGRLKPIIARLGLRMLTTAQWQGGLFFPSPGGAVKAAQAWEGISETKKTLLLRALTDPYLIEKLRTKTGDAYKELTGELMLFLKPGGTVKMAVAASNGIIGLGAGVAERKQASDGVIMADMDWLQRKRTRTEALCEELRAQRKEIEGFKNLAEEALNQCDDSGVKAKARAVIKSCDDTDYRCGVAIRKTEELAKGLEKAMNNYRTLESELARL